MLPPTIRMAPTSEIARPNPASVAVRALKRPINSRCGMARIGLAPGTPTPRLPARFGHPETGARVIADRSRSGCRVHQFVDGDGQIAYALSRRVVDRVGDRSRDTDDRDLAQ